MGAMPSVVPRGLEPTNPHHRHDRLGGPEQSVQQPVIPGPAVGRR